MQSSPLVTTGIQASASLPDSLAETPACPFSGIFPHTAPYFPGLERKILLVIPESLSRDHQKLAGMSSTMSTRWENVKAKQRGVSAKKNTIDWKTMISRDAVPLLCVLGSEGQQAKVQPTTEADHLHNLWLLRQHVLYAREVQRHLRSTVSSRNDSRPLYTSKKHGLAVYTDCLHQHAIIAGAMPEGKETPWLSLDLSNPGLQRILAPKRNDADCFLQEAFPNAYDPLFMAAKAGLYYMADLKPTRLATNRKEPEYRPFLVQEMTLLQKHQNTLFQYKPAIALAVSKWWYQKFMASQSGAGRAVQMKEQEKKECELLLPVLTALTNLHPLRGFAVSAFLIARAYNTTEVLRMEFNAPLLELQQKLAEKMANFFLAKSQEILGPTSQDLVPAEERPEVSE